MYNWSTKLFFEKRWWSSFFLYKSLINKLTRIPAAAKQNPTQRMYQDVPVSINYDTNDGYLIELQYQDFFEPISFA